MNPESKTHSISCEDEKPTESNDPEYISSHLGLDGIRLADDDRGGQTGSTEEPISAGPTPVCRPCKCELCELVFDRVSQLDNHRRSVHRQERSQVCQICGKGFFRQTDLKTHLNIHLGTNRCICEVCGRKFNHMSNLIRHGRTHSGIKPYPCTVCGKRFTQINTLARHKAIHKRGDQSMDCSFCNKRYKSDNGLKEHMRKLHGFVEKPSSEDVEKIIKRRHYCKICGESFQFVELLRDHEKTHQNVKMLECKSCNQKFKKTDEIKEHRCGRQMRIFHDAEKVPEEKSLRAIIIKDKIISLNLFRDNESILLTQFGEVDEDSIYCPQKDIARINGQKSLDLDYKSPSIAIKGSNKIVTDKQTKETIVYVTTEQLANMNTEQVVDTANHFLHEHLMELAVEDNITSRDCDDETVVSEMINSCWKEIEIPDVNESEISEKRILASKNNFQSLIHLQTGSLLDSNTSKYSVRKICDNKRENEKLSHDKIQPKKLTDEYHVNVAESAIGKSVTEPTLRLVQTENGEEFYELLITNCSDKSDGSYEPDRISSETGSESLRPRQQNETITESLLKVVHIENGQRVLEMMKNTLGVEDAVKDSKSSTSASVVLNKNIEENSSEVEESFLEHKNEKIIYFAQNSKDNLIDFFEIETLGTQESGNSFNLSSDEAMQNVQETNFDSLPTLNRNSKDIEEHESPIDNESCEELLGLIHNNDPAKQIEKMKKCRKEEGPMVRLVQNEDGAQFFELIRGDLEFEDTQDPLEMVERTEFHQEDENGAEAAAKNYKQGESGSVIKPETDLPRAKKKYKNKEKKYNCDVCKKSFSKGYNYRQHIGTHFADQQKFKCKECGQFFAWKSTLNKHIATHRAGGQQKFVCEICPKVYTTLSQVNEHVKRDHLKERNNKCTECDKTFFKKFDLKIHIRTHTKERPYECRVCYKSFHHQSHIIRHERIHSGERPYACNICEKTFTQLGSLKNHRQRHQELKIDILDYQMDEDEPLPRTTL